MVMVIYVWERMLNIFISNISTVNLFRLNWVINFVDQSARAFSKMFQKRDLRFERNITEEYRRIMFVKDLLVWSTNVEINILLWALLSYRKRVCMFS